MEKTIFDIMSADERRVDAFMSACDEMMSTQYILVDTKITAVLQAIATSTLLYTLFGNLTKDFEYKSVAKSCLVNNDTEFRTPQEPKKIAALVFCILLDMDKKNIELHDFLNFFKRGGDANSAFENFLKEVILPFKNSVIHLYTKSRQEAAEKDDAETSQKNSERVLNTFIARVNNDANLTDGIKDYLTELFNSLIDAIKTKDDIKARNVFSILCKRLKDHKPNLQKEFERLDISTQ